MKRWPLAIEKAFVAGLLLGVFTVSLVMLSVSLWPTSAVNLVLGVWFEWWMYRKMSVDIAEQHARDIQAFLVSEEAREKVYEWYKNEQLRKPLL